MSELISQNQLKEVIVSGSEILQSSAIRVDKALVVGNNILAAIQESGMDAELDERCNKFLVNCRNAKNEIEVQRKPITSFFDIIRGRFTETEGKLDIKKAGSIPAIIQAHRDSYVKQIRDEEERKRKEAQAKLDKENEAIEVGTEIKKQLSSYIQNHILERKQKLQGSFNTIDLDTYLERSTALKALNVVYKKEHYDAFSPKLNTKYHSADELASIKAEVLTGEDFSLIAAVVIDEITKFKNELVEQLPSLKNELEDLAKANSEKAAEIEQKKKEREAKAAADLKAASDKELKDKEQSLEQEKVAEQTEVMMNSISVSETVAPETRDGFKITILHQAAAAEIFTFWFQREGMNLTIEEIEKKSIAQMKAYCEKAAHKNDDKIISKNLKYEPVYKAINRK